MAESIRKTGIRVGFDLRPYQRDVADKTLNSFLESMDTGVFLSLPQGTGKTIVALYVLSELVKNGSCRRVLVLLPRRTLVDQWVEKAQEMFYGLGIMKNPMLSREKIQKIKEWLEEQEFEEVMMENEIQEINNEIEAQVFSFYNLNQEDVETVLDALEVRERTKNDILAKFHELQ